MYCQLDIVNALVGCIYIYICTVQSVDRSPGPVYDSVIDVPPGYPSAKSRQVRGRLEGDRDTDR